MGGEEMIDASAARAMVTAFLLGLAGIWPTYSAAQPVTPSVGPFFEGNVVVPPPQYSEWGSVQELEGGWTTDAMAVRHSAPTVNPDVCKRAGAGYATDPSDAGHNLFHTLLLSAFLNRKEVSLLISGCAFDKPRIIAVKLR